jgi:hypothetical protein
MVLTDFSDHSTWMMEFSVTLVFWSCVTLGFLNSAWAECFGYQAESVLILSIALPAGDAENQVRILPNTGSEIRPNIPAGYPSIH